jgi:putative ABC transport system permease protein
MLKIRTHAFAENLRFALSAILAHKLRSGLTMLGIVIGVLTVIANAALVIGLNQSMMDNFTSFGATLVQFQKYEPRFGPSGRDDEERARRNLTLEDARALKALAPSIGWVSPERYLFGEGGEVKSGRKKAWSAMLAGVEEEYQEANNHFAQEGRFITRGDVATAAKICVIGPDVVNALYGGQAPLGKTLTVDGTRYTVVGVFEKKGSRFGGSSDGFVMIPLSAFDAQFPRIKDFGPHHSGDTIHIATVPKSPELVERAKEEGMAILRARRHLRPRQPNDFAVMTPDKMIEQTASIRAAIGIVMIGIASLGLLVGGIGVMNIMLVSVTERTREIGTRRALGARQSDIKQQFVTEAATLSGIGGVLGILFGIAIALLIKAVSGFPVAVPLWSVLTGFGVAVAIGLFFGIYPAVKAARLDPITALRYE